MALPILAQERAIYFSGGMGYSDLFKVEADGSNVVRLTNKESRGEYQPHVSPDGKYMVFNTYRYGGWKLAIADLDEDGTIARGTVRKLVAKSTGYEYNARWSTDSKNIAFISFTNGRSGYKQLFITNTTGKNVRQLTNKERNHYAPNFTPDGREIYFQATIDGVFVVEKIDLTTTKIETVIQQEDAHIVSPSLSPNGKLLAFHKVNEYESVTTHVMDLEDRSEYEISDPEKSYMNRAFETPLFSYAIGWSSTNEKFVFTKHQGESIFELYIADLTSKRAKRLTRLQESSTQPSW
ncbi:MAG: hypothetical protein GY816_12350 [Cytophagales bacterium]|nr:hypothetical protein [Cytophagales bacterium]